MGHPAFKTDDSRPQTLLFPHIHEPAADDDRLTLRGCYIKFLRPDHDKKNTQSAYFSALNWWERLTDDLPSGELDGNHAVLEQFVAALLDETSQNNAAKIYRHIRAIFNRIGPPVARYNPAGKHVIDRVPYVKAPEETAGDKRFLSRDELSRLFRASRVATWPIDAKTPAPLWWRGIWVLDSTYGLRPSDLVKICDHHAGLRWKAWHRDPECPNPRLNCRNQLGWLTFTPKKTDGPKPQPLHLPITPAVDAVLREIERFHPQHSGDGLIFPSSRSNHQFHEQRKRICAEAEIDPSVWLQHLRQTAGDRWDRIRMGLGRFVLGHAPRDVNSKHYRNPARPLARFVSKLKEPSAFLELVG